MAETALPSPSHQAALVRALKSFALLRESWVGLLGALVASRSAALRTVALRELMSRR